MKDGTKDSSIHHNDVRARRQPAFTWTGTGGVSDDVHNNIIRGDACPIGLHIRYEMSILGWRRRRKGRIDQDIHYHDNQVYDVY